jgi:hypothetical protein
MIKYKIVGWRDEIEAVEVIRETDKFVVIVRSWGKGERRESKDDYFDTFEEAKAELIRRTTTEIESRRKALSYGEDKLKRIMEITAPEREGRVK